MLENEIHHKGIDKLSDSRAFLDSLLEITTEAIIYINEAQEIILFSTGAEEIFGYSEEEIIGKPLSTLIPDRFHDVHVNHISDFLSSDLNTLLMHKRRLIFGQRKSGEIFPAQASIARRQFEDDLIIVVILRDVSSQSLLDERLQKLSVVVEQTPASVLITDTRGTIEYVNPAFERVTGYTSDEIIGSNPRILKSGLMPDELYQSMWRTISAGEVWKGEICNRKKNGELFWELGTVSPIRNMQGEVTNYISVKEDITERKRTEQELHQYRQRLEELVAMRTAELREEIEEHKRTESILREKEQSLDLALRAGQLGSWEFDFQTEAITWAQEVSRIFGLDPQVTQLTYEKVMSMVHPDDHAMVQDALDDAIQSSRPLNLDHRIISLSGDERFINLTIVPIFDTTGTPLKMVGTVQDITERVRIKAELLEKERLSNELAIARDIQLGMLPRSTPSVEGWQFSTFYQAADQVGGDFYDFMPLPEGKMGLVIADVSGKGIPAALNMALSRAIVGTNALSGDGPVETLLRSNRILHHYLNHNGFLTILFACLNSSTGYMEIANAGHCYPLWYESGTQSVHIVDTHGTVVGLFPDINLPLFPLNLNPGDSLLFYTDGLTEAMNADGEFFEEFRLLEVFEANAHRSSSEILEAIIQQLQEFVGGLPRTDDLTLVIIKRDS